MVATTELFRRQGYSATSLSQIVEASSATTGSIYHFFPGGKDELTAEVLRVSGAGYGDLVESVVRSALDPAVGIGDAFAAAAALMQESDFIDPCPIGTIAREVASTNEPLRLVAAEVMNGWVRRLAAILTDANVSQGDAERLASLVVTTIEGGFVMARTLRDVAPFLTAGEVVQRLVADALGDS